MTQFSYLSISYFSLINELGFCVFVVNKEINSIKSEIRATQVKFQKI